MTAGQRRAAGAKGGRARSPAKKRTARANGAAGGRPRDTLPAEVVVAIGEPPIDDMKKLREWNAKILAKVLWLQLRGEVGTELAASIRASVGSLERVLPQSPPGDDEDSYDDDDDDDDDDPGGPPIVPLAPAAKIYRAQPR